MNCPQDGAQLQMTSRSGVEIDYCPNCRGIWLDRGELDKIIERAESEYSSSRREPVRDMRPKYDDDRRHHEERRYDHDDKHYDNHYDKGHHKKKKEGFLGDLFDF